MRCLLASSVALLLALGAASPPAQASTATGVDQPADLAHHRPATSGQEDASKPAQEGADTGDVLSGRRDQTPTNDTGNVLDGADPEGQRPTNDSPDSPDGARQAPGQTAGAGGQLSPQVPGRFPSNRYEVYYSEGSWVASAFNNVVGSLTALVFGLAKWLVSRGLWVVRQAFDFGVAHLVAEPGGTLARAFERQLIGPLNLIHFALFFAVASGGWQALRGRLAVGAGEVLVSLLVVAASGFLLADPVGLYRSGVQLTAGLSGAVLELATDQPNNSAGASGQNRQGRWEASTAAVRPLEEGLWQALVAKPYDLLNWGEVLTGQCASRRDEILADGPHGTDDKPRDIMRASAACKQYAEFNATPTTERLFGAVLVAATVAVVMVVLGLVALTVIVPQMLGVALIGVLPLAVVAGILPGAGRQALWRWVGAGLQAMTVVVAMAGLLTVLLVGAKAFLSAGDGGLLIRFLLLLVLAAAGLVMRRRMLSGAQAMARQLGGRLEGARVGGSRGRGWLRPGATGGVTGFGVGQLGQEARGDLDTVRRSRLVNNRATRAARQRISTTGRRAGRAGLAAARSGRLARGVAHLTVNAPRAGPRGAARARVGMEDAYRRAHSKATDTAGRAGGYAREWKDGLAHPVASYRQEVARRRARPTRRHGDQATSTHTTVGQQAPAPGPSGPGPNQDQAAGGGRGGGASGHGPGKRGGRRRGGRGRTWSRRPGTVRDPATGQEWAWERLSPRPPAGQAGDRGGGGLADRLRRRGRDDHQESDRGGGGAR